MDCANRDGASVTFGASSDHGANTKAKVELQSDLDLWRLNEPGTVDLITNGRSASASNLLCSKNSSTSFSLLRGCKTAMDPGGYDLAVSHALCQYSHSGFQLQLKLSDILEPTLCCYSLVLRQSSPTPVRRVKHSCSCCTDNFAFLGVLLWDIGVAWPIVADGQAVHLTGHILH